MLSRRLINRHNRGRLSLVSNGVRTNAVAQIGDSITQGAGTVDSNGWRKALYDHVVAETYTVDFVGTRSHGAFVDNAHDGLPNAQIASRTTLLETFYGVGKTFPGGKLIIFMVGTNDIRQGGYVLATAMAHWASMLQRARQLWPFARIIVMTIPNVNAAVDPTAAGRVAGFNAGLAGPGGVWDLSDAANPGNLLLRVDANAIIGPYDSGTYFDEYHPNEIGIAPLAAELIVVSDPVLAMAA